MFLILSHYKPGNMDINHLTKLYYTIGEVAEMFDVSTSLLRYWETQFSSIKPKKDRSGNRRYQKKDIQNIALIHELVKVQGFTLEGAKNHLSKKSMSESGENTVDEVIENLDKLVQKMKSIERN